ncbi:phosphatase PAP2 family protein [Glycomyces sp. TRM65418]|uniref:phosphatase PAP2 family protein n=1 Tax=Glycomyces sp. TRM65418 TaxID=2867006 RepID=UPI001CE54D2D|nr:phosphatase PAP2 family protein [Glycomyces sp. TRM65418]MCC3762764.1 phosphatase PAP2 family protein [Glycomyces sp. TRM65418]QZD56795.1 phosphatase PAP2 family protein [Glycomyces sp. TRM65418]
MIVADQRRTEAPAEAWRPFVPRRPRSWLPEIVMAVAFIALTIPLTWPSPLVHLDIRIRDLADAHRPPLAEDIAVITNMLGQGGVLGTAALGLAAYLGWRGRNVRPLVAFLTAYAMAGAVLVVKDALPRVYPHWPEITDPPYADAAQAVLFTTLEPAGAYPSGHVLNTIVWYGFIIFLVGGHMRAWQRGLLRYAPPVIVTFSTTYLGFHWFTDTPAGLFLGVIILRVVQRIPWDTIELPLWLEPERRYR